MGNVQVRLPDDLEEDLDALAKALRSNRSEATRRALDAGVRALRTELALDRYQAGEWSLERAAQEAKTSLQALALLAAHRGLPYFRYTPEDAEADTARAADAL